MVALQVVEQPDGLQLHSLAAQLLARPRVTIHPAGCPLHPARCRTGGAGSPSWSGAPGERENGRHILPGARPCVFAASQSLER